MPSNMAIVVKCIDVHERFMLHVHLVVLTKEQERLDLGTRPSKDEQES